MGIARNCPYSDDEENCRYEIFAWQPRLNKCPTCERFLKKRFPDIDTSRYNIDENGNVLRDKGRMTDNTKTLYNALDKIKELEKEKCELLGIIQGKDKVIQELKKELKKANEWHYVKDGIMPAENQWVLVYDGSYTVCNYHSNTPIKWLDNYENEVYEGAIIAWQEIVFPKEIKEK